MNDRIKAVRVPGFLTILSVFLIIALAAVGTAALSATGRGSRLTEKSEEWLTKYRDAENLTEIRLSRIDGCIAAAADSGLFDMNFEALVSGLDFITLENESGYYIITCKTPIDDRAYIYLELKIDSSPDDRRGSYEITRKAVVYADEASDEEEDRLNVWQGF